jgi:hypothetical protein
VFEQDASIDEKFETAVIDKNLLNRWTRNYTSNCSDTHQSLDDFQTFAMVRLLRRTADVDTLLKHHNLADTLQIVLNNFLAKYFNFKTRPLYTIEQLDEFLLYIKESKLCRFLHNINDSKYNLSATLNSFIDDEYAYNLGKHLRQEILTNSILPLAFCLASLEKRNELVLWYLSAKTRSKYGVLNRKYPSIPQTYIWQQQGMLEHHKEYQNNRKAKPATDFLVNYSFQQLSINA